METVAIQIQQTIPERDRQGIKIWNCWMRIPERWYRWWSLGAGRGQHFCGQKARPPGSRSGRCRIRCGHCSGRLYPDQRSRGSECQETHGQAHRRYQPFCGIDRQRSGNRSRSDPSQCLLSTIFNPGQFRPPEGRPTGHSHGQSLRLSIHCFNWCGQCPWENLEKHPRAIDRKYHSTHRPVKSGQFRRTTD